MTIKEKKLILIKALGLEIGDLITFKENDIVNYLICEKNDDIILKSNPNSYELNIYSLIKYDWVKLEKPKKKLGDIKCGEISCSECPLKNITCFVKTNETFFEILKYLKDEDKDLYDFMYKRLDVEIEE